MAAKREPSKLAIAARDFSDKKAKEIAQWLLEDLAEVKESQREDFLAFFLSDELSHFFFDAIKLYLTDPDTVARGKRSLAVRLGRTSGAKRWNSSTKLKFLRWAILENERNPNLSKNAIAQKYASEHPGVSVATLRRYLASIPRGE